VVCNLVVRCNVIKRPHAVLGIPKQLQLKGVTCSTTTSEWNHFNHKWLTCNTENESSIPICYNSKNLCLGQRELARTVLSLNTVYDFIFRGTPAKFTRVNHPRLL